MEAVNLTEVEKKGLLDIARRTIESRLTSSEQQVSVVASKKLEEKRGAFVTIKKHGKLRGCIGYIEAIKPLCQVVEEMAEAAAFRDPRFVPLTFDELKDLDIEISVLTPLKQVKDINEIEVGIHGIYIVRKGNSGLLLPQVATEYGWDRQTFLGQTCLKAGLDYNAWRDKDTKIYIFSADVFSETGLK
jgi:AmmeMemoRadiSam system protein A